MRADERFFLGAINGVAEFCAADVADEDFGSAIFDDGEALVFGISEEGFERAKGKAG